MRLQGVVAFFVMGFLLASQGQAQAGILISELLADPPAGALGDANADGITSSTNDEFFELLNLDPTQIDLSGWFFKDAVSTRHIFSPGTFLSPYEYLVVFGGGNPNLPGINFLTASTGTLSLNNTAETVALFNAQGTLIDQVVYGAEGGHDQSLVRYPEGSGTGFVLHSSLAEANGKIFSPGTMVDGRSIYPDPNPAPVPGPDPVPSETNAVPELPVPVAFGLGSAALFLKRKLSNIINFRVAQR